MGLCCAVTPARSCEQKDPFCGFSCTDPIWLCNLSPRELPREAQGPSAHVCYALAPPPAVLLFRETAASFPSRRGRERGAGAWSSEASWAHQLPTPSRGWMSLGLCAHGGCQGPVRLRSGGLTPSAPTATRSSAPALARGAFSAPMRSPPRYQPPPHSQTDRRPSFPLTT